MIVRVRSLHPETHYLGSGRSMFQCLLCEAIQPFAAEPWADAASGTGAPDGTGALAQLTSYPRSQQPGHQRS